MRIWPWSKIRRLEIEVLRLRGALGYPVPCKFEREIDALDRRDPVQCGICAARRKNPWLFRDELFKNREEALTPVERGVIKAAMRFDNCACEFSDDLSCCGEHIEELYHACKEYKRSELPIEAALELDGGRK